MKIEIEVALHGLSQEQKREIEESIYRAARDGAVSQMMLWEQNPLFQPEGAGTSWDIAVSTINPWDIPVGANEAEGGETPGPRKRERAVYHSSGKDTSGTGAVAGTTDLRQQVDRLTMAHDSAVEERNQARRELEAVRAERDRLKEKRTLAGPGLGTREDAFDAAAMTLNRAVPHPEAKPQPLPAGLRKALKTARKNLRKALMEEAAKREGGSGETQKARKAARKKARRAKRKSENRTIGLKEALRGARRQIKELKRTRKTLKSHLRLERSNFKAAMRDLKKVEDKYQALKKQSEAQPEA